MKQYILMLQSNLAISITIAVLLIFVIGVCFYFYQAKRSIIKARALRATSAGRMKAASLTHDSLKKSSTDSNIKLLDTWIKKLPNLDKLRYRLDMSDSGLDAGHYFLINAGIAIIAAGLFALFSPFPKIIGLFLGITAGLGIPHMYISRRIAKKSLRFVKIFPDAIELIVRGLKSGLPVQESFRVIAQEVDEPIAGEFARIAQNIKLGMSMEKALQDEAKRLKLLEFDFFVTSLNLQRETGGNLAEILTNLSSAIRARLMLKLKIRAITSEARASSYIVGALPFFVIAALMYTNPEYLNPMLDMRKGNIAALIAAGMLGTGYFIMNRMASFEI